jgi:hypothetical protein
MVSAESPTSEQSPAQRTSKSAARIEDGDFE